MAWFRKETKGKPSLFFETSLDFVALPQWKLTAGFRKTNWLLNVGKRVADENVWANIRSPWA